MVEFLVIVFKQKTAYEFRISDWSSDVCSSDRKVGGAGKGKAIIILNPAEPPMIMRDSVFTLSEGANEETIRASVEAMVMKVQAYVPEIGSASRRERVCQYV